MKIFHYTTIESLALILKNKTIRFNRLDQVDDLEEGGVASQGIKLGHYVFVSCWTEVEEESIPLWKLYTNGGLGVRIALEWDMFKDYLITDPKIEGLDVFGSYISKVPLTEIFNPNYMILPLFPNKDFFYRKIKYVDNLLGEISDAVEIDKETMKIAFNKIGSYKNKRWEFQDESRFIIVAMPRHQGISIDSPEMGTWINFALKNNIQLPFSDYYMNLKDEIFNTLEITLSPSATMAQEIIVEALKREFAPQAIIKKSNLAKTVKLK